jgi:ADP-ribosylglycohydrolase
VILNAKEYREKVLGCWMGKNIGGTLGAPFEWKRQINDVTFYTQDLGGDPLPNDDLDIQLLWLVAMEEKGIDVDAQLLSEYWRLYVTPHWAEYGTAKINMKSGLMPPLCGMVNNDYKHSCGSFIRSEIWACIAPGFPKVAAKYAYEDAIIDHGNGEGVYGEVFCAALESAAFVEKDIKKLVNIGLSYIPDDCGVTQAVRNVLASYESNKTWVEARDELISKYAGWMPRQQIRERDFEKGFIGTKRGWDVPSNIGIVIIGMLYGEGDFDKSMCIAVNCGEDTDCTGATVKLKA